MVSPALPGIKPTRRQKRAVAGKLDDLRGRGVTMITLDRLPEWREDVGCKTEEIVGIIEYLVESGSSLLDEFMLDMHLVDAVFQCRLRREGRYDSEEWTGRPE
jgi:hypothetical protein